MDGATGSNKNNKELILVLPNTFFHNSFKFYSTQSLAIDDKRKYCRFVVNLIIEISSVLPENKYIATTSEKAYGEFSQKLQADKTHAMDNDELVAIFGKMIYLIKDQSINKLSDEDSMVAIADRLYSASSYEPVVIVNPESKHNFIAAAKKYYGIKEEDHSVLDEDRIPFKIYDPHEIKAFLEARFPIESRSVISKTQFAFRIF